MADFTGTAGNDTQNGTNSDDILDYSQGGRDTLNGRGGDDLLRMGIELRANDRINGGAGFDTIQLFGAVTPYTVVFNDNTIKNCEALQPSAGEYSVTMADGNVAAGAHFIVIAGATRMFFDGSAETDGFFSMDTTGGDDTLIGGQQADVISGGTPFFSPAGIDTVLGEGGDDTLNFFDDLTADDRADGGADYDQMTLKGDYSIGVTLAAATIKNVEEIDLDAGGGGFTYVLNFADGNVAAGQSLFVEANTAGQVTLDGHLETNARVIFNGGAGNDSLTGGARADTITGRGGIDLINPGGGADFVLYDAVSDSTSTVFDAIFQFDFNSDIFVMDPEITGIDTKVTHGTLSLATFDADFEARITPARLGAGHAVVFLPDGGDRAGGTYLIVDANGTAGYQAGQDFVIQLLDPRHLSSLDILDFTQVI